MNPRVDTTLLDGLIVGRVDPHIYAFTTETVPNYLKVGDTYRRTAQPLHRASNLRYRRNERGHRMSL